jgi:hypothetical protein
MTWLFWLAAAVLVTAIAAVTGAKPKGTRHVAHTGLMDVARVVLLVMLAIVGYAIYRAYAGA